MSDQSSVGPETITAPRRTYDREKLLEVGKKCQGKPLPNGVSLAEFSLMDPATLESERAFERRSFGDDGPSFKPAWAKGGRGGEGGVGRPSYPVPIRSKLVDLPAGGEDEGSGRMDRNGGISNRGSWRAGGDERLGGSYGDRERDRDPRGGGRESWEASRSPSGPPGLDRGTPTGQGRGRWGAEREKEGWRSTSGKEDRWRAGGDDNDRRPDREPPGFGSREPASGAPATERDRDRWGRRPAANEEAYGDDSGRWTDERRRRQNDPPPPPRGHYGDRDHRGGEYHRGGGGGSSEYPYHGAGHDPEWMADEGPGTGGEGRRPGGRDERPGVASRPPGGGAGVRLTAADVERERQAFRAMANKEKEAPKPKHGLFDVEEIDLDELRDEEDGHSPSHRQQSKSQSQPAQPPQQQQPPPISTRGAMGVDELERRLAAGAATTGKAVPPPPGFGAPTPMPPPGFGAPAGPAGSGAAPPAGPALGGGGLGGLGGNAAGKALLGMLKKGGTVADTGAPSAPAPAPAVAQAPAPPAPPPAMPVPEASSISAPPAPALSALLPPPPAPPAGFYSSAGSAGGAPPLSAQEPQLHAPASTAPQRVAQQQDQQPQLAQAPQPAPAPGPQSEVPTRPGEGATPAGAGAGTGPGTAPPLTSGPDGPSTGPAPAAAAAPGAGSSTKLATSLPPMPLMPLVSSIPEGVRNAFADFKSDGGFGSGPSLTGGSLTGGFGSIWGTPQLFSQSLKPPEAPSATAAAVAPRPAAVAAPQPPPPAPGKAASGPPVAAASATFGAPPPARPAQGPQPPPPGGSQPHQQQPPALPPQLQALFNPELRGEQEQLLQARGPANGPPGVAAAAAPSTHPLPALQASAQQQQQPGQQQLQAQGQPAAGPVQGGINVRSLPESHPLHALFVRAAAVSKQPQQQPQPNEQPGALAPPGVAAAPQQQQQQQQPQQPGGMPPPPGVTGQPRPGAGSDPLSLLLGQLGRTQPSASGALGSQQPQQQPQPAGFMGQPPMGVAGPGVLGALPMQQGMSAPGMFPPQAQQQQQGPRLPFAVPGHHLNPQQPAQASSQQQQQPSQQQQQAQQQPNAMQQLQQQLQHQLHQLQFGQAPPGAVAQLPQGLAPPQPPSQQQPQPGHGPINVMAQLQQMLQNAAAQQQRQQQQGHQAAATAALSQPPASTAQLPPPQQPPAGAGAGATAPLQPQQPVNLLQQLMAGQRAAAVAAAVVPPNMAALQALQQLQALQAGNLARPPQVPSALHAAARPTTMLPGQPQFPPQFPTNPADQHHPPQAGPPGAFAGQPPHQPWLPQQPVGATGVRPMSLGGDFREPNIASDAVGLMQFLNRAAVHFGANGAPPSLPAGMHMPPPAGALQGADLERLLHMQQAAAWQQQQAPQAPR